MRRFQADRVPRPRSGASFDPSQVSSSMAIDVEVGCGVGFHPIRYARENPGRYLIAIEHTRIKFKKFSGRLAHHPEFANLLAVHADAVEWITHFLPEQSVDRYFFLYPNPYPRAKDENKRWYAMPFMERVLETLKPGGTLTLATNEAFYAEAAKSFMTLEWKMELLQERALRKEERSTHIPRTHFEKKYLERGEVCRDLIFKKI